MTTYLVTRHPGARKWLAAHRVEADTAVAHLDVERVEEGDIVIGTLPINLAAEVCSRGARYLHISLRTPFELRGVALTAGQMEELGATLDEYVARRL